MSLLIVYALISLTWVAVAWVYVRGEERWEKYLNTVIPGSPQVRVADVMRDPEKSPWLPDPVYLGRLSSTKANQAHWEREWAKVRTVQRG